MSNLKDYVENYNFVGWLDKLSEEQVRKLLEEITWKLHDLGNSAYEKSMDITYTMSKSCKCGSCYEWCMIVGDKEYRHEYFIGCLLGDLDE